MIDILVSSAWKSALLAGFAWLLSLAPGRGRAAARHCLWTLAVSGTLLFPLCEWLLPRWSTGPAWIAMAAAPAGAIRTAVPAAEHSDWLLWIWAAGALVFAIRAITADIAAWRIVRAARPAPELTQRAGFEVLESADVAFPFTHGWFRHCIVLPEAAREWPRERLEMVLAHERAHALRRDCLTMLPVRLASVVYWFHPLVWWAAGRVVREREKACDDRVLVAGADAGEFAGHLLAVARDAHGLGWAAAHAAHVSQLEGRLMAILDPNSKRGPLGWRRVAAMSAAVALFVLPLAVCGAPSGKIYRAGGDVKAPALIEKVEPQYTEEAKNAKLEGTVVLSAVIETDGTAGNIQVTRSLNAGLDAKAVEAVGKWRFRPGTKGEKPVRVQATIEINFRLT